MLLGVHVPLNDPCVETCKKEWEGKPDELHDKRLLPVELGLGHGCHRHNNMYKVTGSASWQKQGSHQSLTGRSLKMDYHSLFVHVILNKWLA